MQDAQEQAFQIIYQGLIFVGIILSIISLSISSDSNSTLSISSYSFITTGIVLLVGVLINKIMNRPNSSTSNFFYIFFNNIGPFILLIGILAFTLYLLVTFKEKIDSGNVSSGYTLFSKLSLAFILIQLYVTYNGMQKQSFKETNTLPKIYGSFSYLIGVINVSIVVTLACILKYFSTDG
jgi:hypothetical protein